MWDAEQVQHYDTVSFALGGAADTCLVPNAMCAYERITRAAGNAVITASINKTKVLKFINSFTKRQKNNLFAIV